MFLSLIAIFCLYYIENGSKMLAIFTVFNTQEYLYYDEYNLSLYWWDCHVPSLKQLIFRNDILLFAP